MASEREVLQLLNYLDSNKATGPNEIPVKLFKLSAVLIAEPLSKLFSTGRLTLRFEI